MGELEKLLGKMDMKMLMATFEVAWENEAEDLVIAVFREVKKRVRNKMAEWQGA